MASIQKNSKTNKDSRENRGHRDGRDQRESSTSGIFPVEGVAAIAEYAKFSPQRIREILCKKHFEKNLFEKIRPFGEFKIQIADDLGSETAPCVARVQHDCVAFVDRAEEFRKRQKDFLLMIDHITDPRNLGAIVRSAAYFGVREIIVPDRRQVLLTHSSVATAQGGFALTDLVVVTNVSRAIEELKEIGYWTVGAEVGGEAPEKIRGFYDKTILLLGAEDTGISQLVRKACDRFVGISGAEQRVESLNVSVAAGILLSQLSPSLS